MKRFSGILGMAGIAVLVVMGAAFGTHVAARAASIPAAAVRVEVLQPEVGHGEMRDSCISPSVFDQSPRGPVAC